MIYLLDRNEVIIDTLVNPSQDKSYYESQITSNIDSALLTLDFTTSSTVSFDNVFKVIAQDQDAIPRLFVVSAIDKSRNDGLSQSIQADADHITLSFARPIAPTTLTGVTLREAGAFGLQGLGWQLGQVDLVGGLHDVVVKEFLDPLSYLQQIQDQYGCVLSFRIEIAGKTFTRFVDLLAPSTAFSGKDLVVGKDITGIDRKEDRSEIYDRMVGETFDDEGNVITFESANGGKNYVESPAAYADWAMKGEHRYGIHQYQPEDPDAPLNMQNFIEATREALELVNKPTVSYEVTAAALETIPGLEHEKVRVGMNVRITDEGFAPPLHLTAQVKQTVMPELDDPSGEFSYTFGDYQVVKVSTSTRLTALEAQLAKQGTAIGGKSNITQGDTPPSNTSKYWLDTSKNPGLLKHYDPQKQEWVQDSITNFGDMLGKIINDQIADGAVTANNIAVANLSAIEENVGHLKGGILEAVSIIGSILESVSSDGSTMITLQDGVFASYDDNARIAQVDRFGFNIYNQTDTLVGGIRNAVNIDDTSVSGINLRGNKDFISLGFSVDEGEDESTVWQYLDKNAGITTLIGGNIPDSDQGRLQLRSTNIGGTANGLVARVDINHYDDDTAKWRGVTVQTGMDNQRPGEAGFRTGFEVFQYLGQGTGANRQLLKIDTDDSTKLSYTLLNTDQAIIKSGDSSQNRVLGLALDTSITGIMGNVDTNPLTYIGRFTMTMPAGATQTSGTFNFSGARRIWAVLIQPTDANSTLYNGRAYQISKSGWVTHMGRADGQTVGSSVAITMQYVVYYEAT